MARLKTILQRVREGLRSESGIPTRITQKKIEGAPDGRFPVLVLKLDHLGDFITAIPALELLRSRWRNAEITLLCEASLAALAQSLQVANHVVGVSASTPKDRAILINDPAVMALRQVSYDVAIDLRHDGDTRPILHAFRARYSVGYASKRGTPRLDVELPELEKSARRRGTHRISNRARLSMLVEAAIQSIQVPSDASTILRPAKDGDGGRKIVVSPSARSPIKLWRTERWIELCRRFVEQGFELVLVGDQHDRAICDAIADALPGTSLVNRAGEMTLPEVIETIGDSLLFVGLDTGLAHVASASGSATVVLFSGHADHEVWVPDGPDVGVLRNDVPCAPCHATKMTQCLFDHRCMDIPTDFVWRAAGARLDEAAT